MVSVTLDGDVKGEEEVVKVVVGDIVRHGLSLFYFLITLPLGRKRIFPLFYKGSSGVTIYGSIPKTHHFSP